MKFIAGGMLGKLARWLRMLGHDVIYSVQFDDSEFLKLSKREQRVLLTKDLELYKRAIRKGTDSFYVEGKAESERLAEVAKRYRLDLEIDMNKSNCPLCNSKLNQIPKEQIQSQLEKITFTYCNEFWKCPNCGQIYWQGAHWKQINNMLNQAKIKYKNLVKIEAQDSHFNGIS